MLTYSNYSTEVKNVDWAKVPANIKDKRDEFEGIMEFYNDDADIKDTIDLYVKKLNKYYAAPKSKIKQIADASDGKVIIASMPKAKEQKSKFKVGDLVHWIKNPEEVRYGKEPIINYDRVDKITKIEKNNFGDTQYLTEEVDGNKKGKAYESYLVKAKEKKSSSKKTVTLKPENLTQFKAWLKHNIGEEIYFTGNYRRNNGVEVLTQERVINKVQSNSFSTSYENGEKETWMDFDKAIYWRFFSTYAMYSNDGMQLWYHYDRPDNFKEERKLIESKKGEVVAKKEKTERLSTRQQIAKLPNVKLFMPQHQQTVLMKQNSEELDGVLQDLEKQLSEIPRKQNDGPIKDAIVKAHYFYGESDWFITEYHKGSNTFFGYVILNGDDQMSEPGYISVDEITQNGKIELDFYWKEKPLQKALEATSDYFKPKPKEKPAAKKTTSKKKIEKNVEPKKVAHYNDEFRLIRRFFNMVKKDAPATFRQIQLLYMAFQKAIVSKKVSKANVENSALFKKVAEKVKKLFDVVGEGGYGANITLKDKDLYNDMEKLVEGTKTDYAVTLLNSFIGMQNTMPDAKKAENLLKRINNGIDQKRVVKGHRLWDELQDAIKALETYIKTEREEIPIASYGLAMPSRKTCTNRIKCTGIKANGKAKKGYFYIKGGGVKKALHGPICNNRRKCAGLNADGTLKPGFKYIPGGAVVRVASKKKTKNITRNKANTKKYLGTYSVVSEPTETQQQSSEGLITQDPLANIPVYKEPKQEQQPKQENPQPQPKEKKVEGVISSNELMNMQFDTIQLTGDFAELMQEPARNMRIGIFGKPKNGKTAGSTALANELTKHGNVLYNFVDQGLNKSTQKLWQLSGLADSNKAYLTDTRDLDELEKLCASGNYDYVFIDMINNYIHVTGIKYHEFETRFLKKFKDISFILVFESTKSGDFKGDQGWTHIIDQLINVEDFVMHSSGRYGMGDYVVWAEGLQKRNPKKYAEYFNEPSQTLTEVQL